MGYRTNNKPPKPEDMLPRYTVRNGSTMRADFSCYYYIPKPGHDSNYHDYVGWPAPDYPGRACQQIAPRDMFRWRDDGIMITNETMEPIYLGQEGYTEFEIAFEDEDKAQYLTAEATLDEDLEYWIHLTIDANFPVFHDKPIETRFTLFAKNESGIYDTVVHGLLVVLPGAPHAEA